MPRAAGAVPSPLRPAGKKHGKASKKRTAQADAAAAHDVEQRLTRGSLVAPPALSPNASMQQREHATAARLQQQQNMALLQHGLPYKNIKRKMALLVAELAGGGGEAARTSVPVITAGQGCTTATAIAVENTETMMKKKEKRGRPKGTTKQRARPEENPPGSPALLKSAAAAVPAAHSSLPAANDDDADTQTDWPDADMAQAAATTEVAPPCPPPPTATQSNTVKLFLQGQSRSIVRDSVTLVLELAMPYILGVAILPAPSSAEYLRGECGALPFQNSKHEQI